MKRIILLFVGAIVSFLALSYIDEYENLVLPFLIKSEESAPVRLPERANKEIEDVIRKFNDTLTRAYFTSEPSLLNSGLIDENLRSTIAEDIRYLANEGRIMEMKTTNLVVENVEGVSPGVIEVKTKESMVIRYLDINDRRELISLPQKEYEINYTLRIKDGFKVTSFETVAVRDL